MSGGARDTSVSGADAALLLGRVPPVEMAGLESGRGEEVDMGCVLSDLTATSTTPSSSSVLNHPAAFSTDGNLS